MYTPSQTQNSMKPYLHLLAAIILPLALAPAQRALAQSYPSKPIRFIIGFPPGGSNNIVARTLAPKLTEYLGQQVVVDNRGGANTSIATALAAQAEPDGYTILMNAPGHTTNPWLIDDLSYDSIRDFDFITQIGRASNLLATHPSFPPRSAGAETFCTGPAGPRTLLQCGPCSEPVPTNRKGSGSS